jgi:exodeoxyribonuclease VII large subunit
LTDNSYGYKFHIKLFPAVMQGEEAEQSVIKALEKIYRVEDEFDAVVIIRGGGSQSDLSCFNSYWLNYNICQFPLPVLTGIGHEQDETIADLVAWKRLKTPTAVAEFLIDCFRSTEAGINERTLSLFNLVKEKVLQENNRLVQAFLSIKPAIKGRLQGQSSDLKLMGVRLKNSASERVTHESRNLEAKTSELKNRLREYVSVHNHNLELLEKRTAYLDPYLILKRGYSITYFNGKAVKDPSALKSQDVIDTRLSQGILKSKIV